MKIKLFLKGLLWVLLLANCLSVRAEYLEQMLVDIQKTWKVVDSATEPFEVIHQERQTDFTLYIVKHRANTKVHFTTIVVPNVREKLSLPVVLFADGFNADPEFNVEHILWYHRGKSNRHLPKFVQIYPTLSGRTLVYGNKRFKAAGDLCRDAYEGAMDDSVASLSVAQQLVPMANFSKVLVWGFSRGGNTALMMGVRDKRIDTIVATSAVTSYDQTPFFKIMPCLATVMEDPRSKVASFPVNFKTLPNVKKVFLFHGNNDEDVPVANSRVMEEKLVAEEVDVLAHYYPDETHVSFYQKQFYLNEISAIIDDFLTRLSPSN